MNFSLHSESKKIKPHETNIHKRISHSCTSVVRNNRKFKKIKADFLFFNHMPHAQSSSMLHLHSVTLAVVAYSLTKEFQSLTQFHYNNFEHYYTYGCRPQCGVILDEIQSQLRNYIYTRYTIICIFSFSKATLVLEYK